MNNKNCLKNKPENLILISKLKHGFSEITSNKNFRQEEKFYMGKKWEGGKLLKKKCHIDRSKDPFSMYQNESSENLSNIKNKLK